MLSLPEIVIPFRTTKEKSFAWRRSDFQWHNWVYRNCASSSSTEIDRQRLPIVVLSPRLLKRNSEVTVLCNCVLWKCVILTATILIYSTLTQLLKLAMLPFVLQNKPNSLKHSLLWDHNIPPSDILGFQSPNSLSKTKAYFCSWRQRNSDGLCIIKAGVSPLSLTLPLFMVCTRQCLKGGSIQASTRLNFNVTDSIIGTHFILHFHCIVSASVLPYKAWEGEGASILSSPACLLELIKVNNVQTEPGY